MKNDPIHDESKVIVMSSALSTESNKNLNNFIHLYVPTEYRFDMNEVNPDLMSTYNAIRSMYRTSYDLRSMGYHDNIGQLVGREVDPFTGILLDVNYYNDFSLSRVFTKHNLNHRKICIIQPMASYAFVNSKSVFSNSIAQRLKDFDLAERLISGHQPNNQFTYTSQVNPLLYAYSFLLGNKEVYMDADEFLHNGIYQMLNDESYVLRGNQCGIPMWADILDTSYTIEKHTKFEQDIANDNEATEDMISYRRVYKNKDRLFNDDYTDMLVDILRHPTRYYVFNSQNDYKNEDKATQVSEKDTRGHLLMDLLSKLVYRSVRDQFLDSSEENNKKLEVLSDILFKPAYRNEFESGSEEIFPMDQLLSTFSWKMNEAEKSHVSSIKSGIDPQILSMYQHRYSKAFKDFFKLLPYMLSPSYKADLLSPAMISYLPFDHFYLLNFLLLIQLYQ